MPTNLALPAYSDVAPSGGACPVGYYGMPHAGPFTNCKVFGGWWDYDFQRTKDGQLIVAACPTAQDGDYGELWVARYDDAYPPNYASHIVVETSKIWGCTLLIRPDGILDVFYIKSGTFSHPHHRFSRDGGLTWSAAEVHSASPTDFDESLDPRTVSGSFVAGSKHPLPACLLSNQNMLAMVMDGAYAVGKKGTYLLAGRLKADGERWEFTGKKHIGGTNAAGVAFDANIGNVNHLQAMPDGSIITSPSSGHITKLKADATCTIEYWATPGSGPPGSGTYPRTGGGVRVEADWKQGRRLGFASTTVSSGQPLHPFQKYWRWGQFEFTSGSRWTSTGAAFYPPASLGANGTDADYELGIRALNGDRFEDDGFDAFDDNIPISKQRPDGRWEFLRVNHLAELEFARCSVMPDDNVTTWDGR
jgi:hypothetical protein